MNLARHAFPMHRPLPPAPDRPPGPARIPCLATAHAGKASCLALFDRHPPAEWLALAPAQAPLDALPDTLLAGTAGGTLAYPAIVAEAGRALRQGIGDATPPALLLLAAVALAHERRAGALRLAAAALELAARQDAVRSDGMRTDGLRHERVRALHAALVAPFAGVAGAAIPSVTAPGRDANANADPFGILADAVRARHAGKRLDALAGFERSAGAADRDGHHWLAGFAWEHAAQQAQACGLDAAVRQYRALALAAYGHGECGASGRAALLRRTWGDSAAPVTLHADQAQAERERILRAGSVGELGLSIAHEVNQPLAAIALHAAAARKWLRRPQPDIERALASLVLIGAAGRHAGDIVRGVQRMAARQETEMGSVAVDRTIGDTLRLLQRPLRKHGIALELALGLGGSVIHANRVQLQQVMTNLLVNAIEALAGMDGGAAGCIRVQSRHAGPGEVEISVADNGPGIARQDRERVFGSRFSTKPASTGMGLAISMAIVRAHGGQLGYEAREPHGACFRLRLPVRRS